MAAAIDRTEERRVEAHSAELKKELGLRDLVLQQIVFVVGTAWVGTAAKLGHSQVVFWLAAMLFFYLPQAAVVIHLSRRMPLEGGLYQWARLGLGELVGFLVAWNLWIFAVVLIATIGLVVSTSLSYAVGPSGAWMASNKTFIMVLNALLLCGLMVLAAVGLGVSKWLHNAGSVMLMAAFVTLIALPFVHMARGTLPNYHPFAVAMPAFSLLSLNIFGKMGMGALSGFEYVAVLAGETKDPGRMIGRATVIAAPIIAAMFILGTSGVLAFVPTDQIDLIGPIPQVFRIGFGASGVGAIAAAVAILLITSRTIANSSIIFTATTRMPMVAGWDNLLPRWFTTLHPRYRTPINSILFVGLVALAFGAVGIAGVGEQEAFQLLENAAGIFYGLTYLVMFAIPLIGLRREPKPSVWLRIASASGFAVTLLYVVLSVFPIIDVASWLSFAGKISGVVIGLNLVGVILFLAAQRRRAVTVAAMLVLAMAGTAKAQLPTPDSTKCDSIVFASRVDSVRVGFFALSARVDGFGLTRDQSWAISTAVATTFTVPRPLRLSVFSGPARMRSFRRIGGDTLTELRAPTVSGVYRFWATRKPERSKAFVVRASLIHGFDAAAVEAVEAAQSLRQAMEPPLGNDSMLVEISLSTDSSLNARRFIEAFFPRMPLIDAVPDRGNPAPAFPESEKLDSTSVGEVVFRFVVDRSGAPAMETVEVTRGKSLPFVQAAVAVLPKQHFTPASIRGCKVSQVVSYPFAFVMPDTGKSSPRH